MKFIGLIQKKLIIFGRKLTNKIPIKYHHEVCTAKKESKNLIKMKIFKCVENDFQIIGLSSHQSRLNYPFNVEILVILCVSVCGIISDIVYLFSETKTFEEFNGSLYEISSALVVAVSYLIFTRNMLNLFRFINSLEAIVQKS